MLIGNCVLKPYQANISFEDDIVTWPKLRGSHTKNQDPKCSPCVSTRSSCEYISSNASRISEHRLHLSALEKRIADPERELCSDGNFDVAEDHWERLAPKGDMNCLSWAIRDFSLTATGFYVGGTTHFSLGHLLEAALPAGQRPGNEAADREAFEPQSVSETVSVEEPWQEEAVTGRITFF
ncbi:hypothetical protein DL765_002228 [Monosporascus sp. GIB2]|nr:hypothetical protein DL765_002228 [Monosporascus sp. GIB2]